ncbi:MAG TPA: GNAT family N-acetyltransferase [Blastocatellia bacterium]|nr:GNAT family N-acetyltransferase [Blastocatellia bacterium]
MSIANNQPAQPLYQEGDVVLKDGSTIHVRPIRPDDEDKLLDLLLSLSQQSRWLRFFAPVSDASLTMEAHREVNVDYTSRFGVVATKGSDERIVGHAFYIALAKDRAEVAFTISDEFQGRGLGTILLGQLAAVASANGIHLFEADVLSANHKMIGVFRESGFPIETAVETGQLRVTFPTELTPEAIERFEMRERIAARSALAAFFRPRSVAVVGASRQRDSIGGKTFHNLLSYGFNGPVYAVNPTTDVVQSVPTYPTVESIPGPVDLAVIVVPARSVVEVAEACGRKGVRALVVITAGFAEAGEEGRALQQELLRVCRATGMRLIGPNCMGILNTAPDVRLAATFAPAVPPTGRVGFSSQSGALGVAIIEYAKSLGLGLSTFVSVGNKADISGNDLLRYWEEDEGTDVILLYLESFGNPKRFSEIARRVGRKKPIVVVKSGRSAAGARATSSHTGALIAASEVTVEALFHQAGVIRTDTLEELFDVTTLLANQPFPRGRRVGIITNGGGPAILCADACEAEGLEVPILDQATESRLRAALAAGASVGNPVDLTAWATHDHYREAIEAVAADPNVDALIIIFIPPLLTRARDVARVIMESARKINRAKPVITVFMSAEGVPEELRSDDLSVPSYAFPEAAAIALARAARYGEWRERPATSPPRFDGLRRDEAAAIVATALERGDCWLTAEETAELFSCYGLPLAAEIADRMNAGGVEMIVGAVTDPQFGPVVACGAGGALGELLSDVSVRLTPLTREDASEMVRSLKTYPLLTGFRGSPPSDTAALEEGLLRVSAMVEDIPQIAELDCKPFVVHESGAVILDARVRVAASEPARLFGVRG